MTWLETRNLCCALERPVPLRGRFQRCPTHKRREHISKKIERLRLPVSTPLPVLDCKRTELQKPRLLGMQLQVELPHSFGEFRPKLFGIRLDLEAQHDIVRESHHDHIAMRPLPTPRLNPQVEHVVQVDIGQQRSTPNLLEIFNVDRTQLYATLQTI